MRTSVLKGCAKEVISHLCYRGSLRGSLRIIKVKGIRHLVIVPMFSYMHVIKEIIYIYIHIARHKHT